MSSSVNMVVVVWKKIKYTSNGNKTVYPNLRNVLYFVKIKTNIKTKIKFIKKRKKNFIMIILYSEPVIKLLIRPLLLLHLVFWGPRSFQFDLDFFFN